MKHMKKKFLRSLTDVKSWNKKKSLLVCNNGTFLFLLQIGGHMSKEGGGVSNELFFKSIYLYISWFEQKFLVFSLFKKICIIKAISFVLGKNFRYTRM